jgi:hypothetical protein
MSQPQPETASPEALAATGLGQVPVAHTAHTLALPLAG